jgi:hypothetical protein
VLSHQRAARGRRRLPPTCGHVTSCDSHAATQAHSPARTDGACNAHDACHPSRCACLLCGHDGAPPLVCACRAECEVKSLGDARNGTAGYNICVPNGSPATPVTLDDLQDYDDCSDSSAPACETTKGFLAATGCGSSCLLDFAKSNDRTTTFCATMSTKDTCAVQTAPCKLPKNTPPQSAMQAPVCTLSV